MGFGSNVDIDYLLPKEMQYDLHISCQCFTSNLITLSDFTKYRNLAFYPHTWSVFFLPTRKHTYLRLRESHLLSSYLIICIVISQPNFTMLACDVLWLKQTITYLHWFLCLHWHLARIFLGRNCQRWSEREENVQCGRMTTKFWTFLEK